LTPDRFDLDEVKAPDSIGLTCNVATNTVTRADALAYTSWGNRKSFTSPKPVDPFVVESLTGFHPFPSNVLMSKSIATSTLTGIPDKLLQPLHQVGLLFTVSHWLIP
jgi:hypothetical protein